MVNLREKITEKMSFYDESWNDVVSCTLTEEQLNEVFDNDYERPEGGPFTVWTKDRVYFPTENNGPESCASVSRNPDGNPTNHI